MSSIRMIFLNVFVSALISAAVAWAFYQHNLGISHVIAAEAPRAKPAQPPPPSDEQILHTLGAFVARPNGGPEQEQRDVISDEAIASIHHEAARMFLLRADSILSREANPSVEDYFALGRVALLQNYKSTARKYLQMAATKNYPAAYGYLGDPALAGSVLEQWRNYDTAERLGFPPARLWKRNVELKAIAAIERFSADPQDPQLPQGKYGISNARIMALDNSDIDTLIEDYGFYPKLQGAPAYLAYGLGRAAFLHQMYKTARDYLSLAAQRGSAAACAYLAYPELTSNPTARIALLQKAVTGNYKPAERRLHDVQADSQFVAPTK